jgi:hypothetical protein
MAGETPESANNLGSLALPQVGVAVMLGPLSEDFPEPHPANARPHSSTPTRPETPWFMSRVSGSRSGRSIQNTQNGELARFGDLTASAARIGFGTRAQAVRRNAGAPLSAALRAMPLTRCDC